MQISLVRAGLADAARTITLPDGVGALTSTGYVPDSVAEPHFFVAEAQHTYDRAMGRGLDEVEFTCRVLVGRQDDRTSQELIDLMLSGSGTGSLKAALEAARGAPGEYALGGAAHDLHVMRAQGPRWYEHAGTQYVGAELTVKVIGEGAT
ncbi:hypothetical protein GCM10023347_34030 [Streptomyces chumphonensis]|uniref:Uncharacterized protein n=1 Tax=Streptomyces chumphonensis TaxID=1214925 RepID=A0A927F050_9ACTN|nr:hypothetical protein [Streptomyces chumphonensis]MBD3931927.1 hypothetical protein [Streptomyces chumphonensis]